MTANRPRFSVVIAAFNRESLLGRAIESALAQTFGDLEVVVVDDGSTDSTLAIAESYTSTDSRVVVATHAENRGVGAAKNTGVRTARGDFVILLDSDDWLMPNALEAFQRRFDELGPEYGMVFADLLDPATKRRTGRGVEGDQDVSYGDVICGRLRGEFLGAWRADLFEGLQFDERVPGLETLVWNEMYRRCRVRYISRPLGWHSQDTPGSISHYRPGDISRYRGLALGKRRYIGQFGDDLRSLCPERLAHEYQGLAVYSALGGQRRQALAAGVRGLRHSFSLRGLAVAFAAVLPRSIVAQALMHWRRPHHRPKAERVTETS